MNLLADLAARLPSRWLLWQGLPGLIYLAAIVLGSRLGYRSVLDFDAAAAYTTTLADRLEKLSGTQSAALLIVAAIAAAALGLVAAAMAVAIEFLVYTRRVPAWPSVPLRQVEQQFRTHYLLDIATVWPHLWLQLPEEHRNHLIEARTRIRLAAITIGWGVVLVPLAAAWPLAWLPALVAVCAGGTQLRIATAGYARAVAAAVRRYTPSLASDLGVGQGDTLTRDLGRALQYHLQFDDPRQFQP
ncbi:hypothetical protein [Nocardia sp. NPDC051832]|uniref:hypothetical protein n=1 Tax=Nocardia sp. NPDC051832 TaxID=3155673 RepID=UPI00342D878B